MHNYRSHTCADLKIEDVGSNVRLSGWVHRVRDHGGVLFIDLRDHYGVTQVLCDPDSPVFSQVENVRSEWCIRIDGEVKARDPELINTKISTGGIEVFVRDIEVLGASAELPLMVFGDQEYPEETRLRYRYLDLRREVMQENIKLRADVIASIRRKMWEIGFREYQTPIITASSPEGARDFLVPSRLHEGKFYALPQAPQQFKQLIMVSGFDKYFQIAPCFRDEDPRADRSPTDFYQLDMEMSFVTQQDVFDTISPIIADIFKEFGGGKVVDGGGSRKFCDRMNSFAQKEGLPGMGYIFWRDNDGHMEAAGPLAKNIGPERTEAIREQLGLSVGDAAFFLGGTPKSFERVAGKARNVIGDELNLIDKNRFAFAWIVDFPIFEKDDETGKIDFEHNPFSMPQGGLDALNGDPLSVLGYQYDLACNGFELVSGAIRNHQPDLMFKAFEIAGYGEDEVRRRFGGMVNAFQFGAPPHGGCAAGIDRIVMLLANQENIREVIMFPMNQRAEDLMMGAPSEPTSEQLMELNLRTIPNS
ncbi:MAG: aspartate--tRNA ligase [Rhodobacteraceae bacterium]|nr:aspartate--tRNA ligase [Paracoccaceae bacterium]